MPTPISAPAPGTGVPHGPLVTFLTDPNAFIAQTWNGLASWVTTWWPVAAPSVIAVSGLVSGARLVLRARHRRLMANGARLTSVQLPPQAAPDSAGKFWSHLHAVLRPRWRRLLDGQPHLTFEYCFTEHGATIGIWVPGTIPPGVVETAVESAWPGARTTCSSPRPHRSPPPHTRRLEVVCGWPDARYCRSRSSTTPIRCALCSAPAPR